jgi:hypothetical protein
MYEVLACPGAQWLSGLALVASDMLMVASDGLGSAVVSDESGGGISL